MIKIILERRSSVKKSRREAQTINEQHQKEIDKFELKKQIKAKELEVAVGQSIRNFKEEAEWLIDYANNENHEFRHTLSWKRGKGVRLGTTIALSNAIMGAFLYIITKRVVRNYNQISVSNILEVNGLNGENQVETFISSNNKTVKVLGSTSRNLKITKIENGVKYLKPYNPQQKALDFLTHYEDYGYSINELSVKKMKELATLFTKEISPAQFQ
jgi:hypothetical protein